MNGASRDEVMPILDGIDDVKLAAVMALETTRDEVIQAKLWLTHADLREAGVSGAPSDKVGRIYDTLRADAALEWDER